jgi:uncharacterized protein YjfI (DUF2170 family)
MAGSPQALATTTSKLFGDSKMKPRKNITGLLLEIQEACAIATTMDDVSLNAVIEEINTLAKIAINVTKSKENYKAKCSTCTRP